MRDPHLLLPLSSSPRSHVHQQCSRNPLGTLQKLLSDGSYTRLKELTFTRRLLAGDGAMHEWVIANIARSCRSNVPTDGVSVRSTQDDSRKQYRERLE